MVQDRLLPLTLLFFIPATRNSILTLGLGLPFDHVVVYHRFFGRFTFMLISAHFFYFIDYYSIAPFVYLSGLGAMICCLIILLTSLDTIRRKYFNLFYWSHYSFVGYLVLAYYHCTQTKPFILAAVAIYFVDKLLRMVWMAWPVSMTTFKSKDSVAQVQFLEDHHFVYLF
jgi:hypothetical protein